MHEETTDPIPSLGEPGTAESTPSQTGTADVAPSNDPAGAEGQAARAASDCTEATATSPVKHDAFTNPNAAEQATDHDAAHAEPGSPEPVPSQTGTADAAASNDPVGAEGQVARAASDDLEATATSPVNHDAVRNPDTPERTTDPIPSLGEPGTAESTPSQTGTADVAPSNDPAGAEGQVARAASDSPEATATCLVKHDASGNPDMPEQAIDLNLSPSELGTAGPTSPADDMSDASARKDEAGAEGQTPPALSNAPHINPLLTAAGSLTETTEDDDGGCFEPFIPQASVSPAPQAGPETQATIAHAHN